MVVLNYLSYRAIPVIKSLKNLPGSKCFPIYSNTKVNPTVSLVSFVVMFSFLIKLPIPMGIFGKEIPYSQKDQIWP